MAPLNRGEDEFEHLLIAREPEREPERRRRPALPGRPPIPPDRLQHGRRVAEDTALALQRAAEIRQRQGIDPSRLLVLKFNSINVDLRDALEERFHAYVVDERKDKVDGQDHYRLLVQFPDEEAIQAFREDLDLYQVSSSQTHTLPPGMRRTFFDGIQEVGLPSREDRLGVRLRAEGFPAAESFYLDVDLWHPGNEEAARQVREAIRSLCQQYGGELTETVRTESLLLIKVRGPRALGEALLSLELVARVDLPPRLSSAYTEIFSEPNPPDPAVLPSEDAPLACVVDSGVVAGHPMLINWVIRHYQGL